MGSSHTCTLSKERFFTLQKILCLFQIQILSHYVLNLQMSFYWNTYEFDVLDIQSIAVLFFKFKETPESPSPPEVSDVTKTSAILSWQPPTSDGGSKITGYILEMKEQYSSRWSVVAKPQDVEHKVTKLSAGKEYEFRVLAENKAGLSEPSRPSKSFVAKDAYGETLLSIFVFKVGKIDSVKSANIYFVLEVCFICSLICHDTLKNLLPLLFSTILPFSLKC